MIEVYSRIRQEVASSFVKNKQATGLKFFRKCNWNLRLFKCADLKKNIAGKFAISIN